MVDLPRVRSIIWSTGGSSTLEEVKEARRLRGREGGCKRDCEWVWKRRVRSSGVLEEREKDALRSREVGRRRRRSKGLRVEEEPFVVGLAGVGSKLLAIALWHGFSSLMDGIMFGTLTLHPDGNTETNTLRQATQL